MQLWQRVRSGWQTALEHQLGVQWMIIIGTVALMTIIAPFNTDILSYPDRLLYWGVCIPAGFVGGWLFARWLKPLMIRRKLRGLIPPVEILAITLAALGSVLIMEAALRQPVPPRFIGVLFFSVGVVAVAIWGVVTLSIGPGTKDGQPEDDPALKEFRDRWPPDLRDAGLRALAAEDHYIRVYTDRGEALISGRFADALEAAARLDGVRVHRSWWVAGDGVRRLDRTGGNWQLDLGDGLRAPVSRRFRPDVRARGWDRLGA